MISAALIPADRPEQAIKAPAPGTISPAPLFLNGRKAGGSDGEPSKPSDCAGGAKMHVRQTHAGRAASGRVSYAKQSQAVTNSTTGRTARSGRTPFPAPRRATPLVVGARVRRSPLRKGQNLACALRENANRAPALSHPSCASDQGHDGIGARLSGMLLPLLAAPRHLLLQETFSQPVHVRQDPPCCMSDVFQSFRLRFICHVPKHGSGDVLCPTNPLYE